MLELGDNRTKASEWRQIYYLVETHGFWCFNVEVYLLYTQKAFLIITIFQLLRIVKYLEIYYYNTFIYILYMDVIKTVCPVLGKKDKWFTTDCHGTSIISIKDKKLLSLYRIKRKVQDGHCLTSFSWQVRRCLSLPPLFLLCYIYHINKQILIHHSLMHTSKKT